MAKIQTAISVQDGLSVAFQRMTKSIEATTKQFEKVQTLVQSGVNSTGIDKATNSQSRLNDEMKEGTSIAGKFGGALLAIGGALATFFGAGKVLKMSDELTQSIGRLNLVNDGLRTTDELQRMIYASAQRTGTAYGQVADSVAAFRQRAGDVFKTNDEALAFSEVLNKSFNIANASQMETASATLQLTQALGSGVLRGEELNAVFEAAPNIIKTIADYMDVPIGKIRDMASDGEITANIIKNAMMQSADDINKQFESLPFTSVQLWQRFKNTATMAFSGVLESINNVINGERFSAFMETATNSLWQIASVATSAFNIMANIGSFLYDNWSLISPILIGVTTALGLMGARLAIVTVATWAQTAAQWALNTALAASPLTWAMIAIGAIVGLIYLAVAATNKWAGTTISATGVIAGSFMTALAFVGNLFVGLWNLVAEVFKTMWNQVATLAEFFANVFDNPLRAAMQLFAGWATNVLGIVGSVAKAIDAVFGSNLSGAINGWKGSIQAKVDAKYGENEVKVPKFNDDSLMLNRFEYGKAYETGYNWGSNIGSSFSGGLNNPAMSMLDQLGAMNNTLGDVSDNTGRTADSVEVSKEDLKYLRDSANASAINRFTTASISVDMNNNNTINSSLDLDGIVDELVIATEEAMNAVASGV